MPKSPKRKSSFAAFTSSTEGLILVEAVMRRALEGLRKGAEEGDADSFARFRDVSEDYLKVVDRCRVQLQADLQSRTAYESLRRTIESEYENGEVQQNLEAHFVRMGWGSMPEAKARLREYLINDQGLDPESAETIVREGLPRSDARSRTLPAVHKMRKVYRGMEDRLDEQARDLEEALDASEGIVPGPDGGQATTDPKTPSEEG